MATLILSAVGTAVGGPIGGAVGALLGRAVDGAVLGEPTREGPRLTELAVTTSSYGQAVPRVYGSMRLPGTIVWATDLVESSETSGRKGQPKTRTYSYSISFAVALSSRPIASLGRIWADGALLRGSAGDLKVGGRMRLYAGHGDEPPDPLIAADMGAQTVAFRGLALAVFEDLELASFGNRIPALSFEVHAPPGTIDLAALVPEIDFAPLSSAPLTGLAGFADYGGTRSSLLQDLGRIYPIAVTSTAAGLLISQERPAAPAMLPAAIVGREGGEDRAVPVVRRSGTGDEAPTGLRYYDAARDFQPSQQLAPAASGMQGMAIEFPGVFTAETARARIADVRRRALTRRETLSYRIGTPSAEYAPGRCVRRIGDNRMWFIRSADWHADGVDLHLERIVADVDSASIADPGTALGPADEQAGAIVLRYFELPWDGMGTGTVPQRFAAVSMSGVRSSIALLGVENDALVPLGISARGDAVQGQSLTALSGSPGLLFEPEATLDVMLSSVADRLLSVEERALLDGANRLLLGEEILQFRFALPLGGGAWRLSGLLRGRGGTEHHAAAGHAPGVPAVLLDSALIALGQEDYAEIGAQSGLAHSEPVYARLASPGRSMRPLPPVHLKHLMAENGDPLWRWVRRARGAWRWLDGVDAPLNEESEAYRVGLGPEDSPHAKWDVAEARFSLPAAEWENLQGAYPAAPLWVRQIGTHALSRPTLLPSRSTAPETRP
ncbi:GTA baseplate fiber-binding domain-containing protein [Alteriqipengyuania lutimaris]|uniref:Uncharacterized protein n=1 Tax=Alteriqipengyuania lutimaris TaxID=1538146 RepID=A0A395LIP6_9SPHN|nr:phage tail protein [Alteriqipengyuania lutimaris]MBB3034533.1 hypothetical protein [Alteriqipengyuania lutimaris]RDS76581.1 hypothetical protein DL238_02490 [Alteriqipengyuania lutimaris]